MKTGFSQSIADPRQSFNEFIKETLKIRLRANRRYSLRALAKHLGVSPSFLSHLLSGKRPVTSKIIDRCCSKLGLTPSHAMWFKRYHGLVKADAKSTLLHNLHSDQFAVMSQWYHYAILELMLLSDFRTDLKWVASVLGVPFKTVTDAVNRLVKVGLLQFGPDGSWKSSTAHHTTVGNPFTTVAFRNLQKQIISGALDALESTPFEERDQSSLTIALNSSQLSIVKKRIKDLRAEISALQDDSTDRDQVYHMSFSVYPILKKTKGKL